MTGARAVMLAGILLLALLVGTPGSAQEAPTVAPTASDTSPPAPPPPPPPQAGTRVVATQVGPVQRLNGDATRDVRVAVLETGVAGVSGGWSVTASVPGDPDGNGRGAVRPQAVTVTGDGGVPRATVGEGSLGEPTTLLEVAGQREQQTYQARYLTLGSVRFGSEAGPRRPVVVVTLIQ